MKKIFRMANAELSKIFMRPSMFVLTGVLIVALVLSFFFFNPSEKNTKFTYSLTNTSSIYTSFQNDYSTLEQELITAKTDIDEYMEDTGGIYEKFSGDFHSLKIYFYGDFTTTVLSIAENENYLSSSDYEKCKIAFTALRAKIQNLMDYMLYNIKNKKINFILTNDLYNKTYTTLSDMFDNLPSDKDLLSFTASLVVDRYNLLKNTYDIEKLDIEISKLEIIEIDMTSLEELLNQYFYTNFDETTSGTVINYSHTGKLETLYNDVITYYNEHIDTTQDEFVYEMNERVAKFYDYIQICKALIANNFELLRIGDKTDDQIANYVGFSGVSIYNLKKQITTSKYFYDNNTFGYEYLTAFNYNINSGTQTNAYDFAFYAMQILSAFIIVFVIFFATSMLSGEQSSGTLKMTATRPFTRNKIYSGKFLACFNVALILLGVSLLASLAIGFATFGFSFQNVLVVVNAESLFITNPVILMLIYFGSILIDVIFYIALAILISMLIKQATVSTGITSAIFIVSQILFGTVTASWTRFVPTLNLGLYKFFTISNTGMFSFSVVPNTSLITCGIFAILFTLAFDLFARLLFTHRNLDK
ncbi:MAG: hypothetical protein E7376_00695 [Clostridiales bacterium]|nr:hypothetical protein [Clostridiales bacterium]